MKFKTIGRYVDDEGDYLELIEVLGHTQPLLNIRSVSGDETIFSLSVVQAADIVAKLNDFVTKNAHK